MRGSLLAALPIFFLSLSSQVFSEPSVSSAAQIVQDANRLLAEGSYSAAARAYGEAIELDPTAHANYYKRATAYLSMGRHNAALDDFEQILKINPGFVQVSAILSFIASVALLFWCEEKRTTKVSSMKVG